MKSLKILWCLFAFILLAACADLSSPADEPPEPPETPEEESETPDLHEPAPEPQTTADPVSDYCGNTITKVTLDGETYSFWGGDSVTLTDIVINLDYDPDSICRCRPEFTVDTEFGSGYGVNLSNTYVRCDAGQAPLTLEQA